MSEIIDYKHYTVMKDETLSSLNIENERKNKIYVDCTLGGGGHSRLILEKLNPKGKLLAFDIDEDAIKISKERLKDYKNLTIVNSSYTNIKKILQLEKISEITGGILLDLGASYHQLTASDRGFSFVKEAPLDMRFSKTQTQSAYDVVNTYSEKVLADIFYEYGEERFSRRIASNIITTRKFAPIKTTKELSDLIIKCTPRTHMKIHPATRVFQALRIEVNQELKNIKFILEEILPLLSFGAIISVISFHSLEDRIVKNFFKEKANKCNCPKNKPVCDCPPPSLNVITKKPLTAGEKEIRENPPSRSAKLRVAEKI